MAEVKLSELECGNFKTEKEDAVTGNRWHLLFLPLWFLERQYLLQIHYRRVDLVEPEIYKQKYKAQEKREEYVKYLAKRN